MIVVITGGAGQIAYSLLPLLCNGLVFGPATRLAIRLLDIEPAKNALEGVAMELQDSAYDLVDSVVATTNADVAFAGAEVAILLGGFPRKEGMERRDLIAKNVGIMRLHGEALERHADRNVKVVVVANPANTNALTAMRYAPSIPPKNFSCLTRLDHDRLRGMLAAKLTADGAGHRVSSQAVRNVVIWGNHSSTQVPDVSSAEAYVGGEWQSIGSLISDRTWLEESLVPAVQKRGAAVIAARKLSSALSAANAVAAHLRDWLRGTPDGAGFVSMGVLSDGKHHGVPAGLVFSMPVRCAGGNWEVADSTAGGAPLGPPGGASAAAKAAMDATIEELRMEKKLADEIIGAHAAL